MPQKSHIASAIGLFFLSPLIAEFLLGNLPIKMLPALIVLAPMYGGGALLIREVARRTGRGWPSILVLGLAYGIVEEAFTTQSLFNPNYLSLNQHLLDPGYIPALGMGAWWTLFVLTLHTAWSICTSIALMEALAPSKATEPWLGRGGLAVAAVLFILGAIASTLIGYRQDHYLAGRAQLVWAAAICLLLIQLSLRTPQRSTVSGRGVPNAWVAGALTLVAGSAVLLVPKHWGWWAAISHISLGRARLGSGLVLVALAQMELSAISWPWPAALPWPTPGTRSLKPRRSGTWMRRCGSATRSSRWVPVR